MVVAPQPEECILLALSELHDMLHRPHSMKLMVVAKRESVCKSDAILQYVAVSQ